MDIYNVEKGFIFQINAVSLNFQPNQHIRLMYSNLKDHVTLKIGVMMLKIKKIRE